MALDRVEIQELLDEYVVCRTLGHAWDELPDADFSPELFRTSAGALALRCQRCHTLRYDYIGKAMDVVSRRYVYPNRYTTIPGEGTRPNLRGELFRRSLLIHRYRDRRNGKGTTK
jgi:hypothetical protein